MDKSKKYTYFHYIPDELLIIISSKIIFRKLKGLISIIPINTIELLKLNYPYLYKLLLKENPKKLQTLYNYNEYILLENMLIFILPNIYIISILILMI